MIKYLSLFALFLTFARPSDAQVTPMWMQEPAISPDGKWIAFEYKGDLFKVPSSGGTAIALTQTKDYEGFPVWSHDGSKIAFAGDRYGNFDVYVMSSAGGPSTRLTFNSAKDLPEDFTPDDKNVAFATARHDIWTSVRYPIDGLFLKLYEVPVEGGRPIMINSAGTEHVHFNKAGDKFIFQDRKGYESEYRKHHTSSVTRDIWIYNMKDSSYTQISGYKGEDREPVWGDGNNVYYLSERNGDQNLFKVDLADTAHPQQLTHFEKNPVRNLSRANDGEMAFTYDGQIYTLQPGGQPKVVPIEIQADFATDQIENVPVSGGATEMKMSPNGKEIAFVFHGEIFVTAVEGGMTKRITNTPYQERMVDFSPDGRTLVYSVEKDSTWDIYTTSIVNKDEPYFYASTLLKTEPLIATSHQEFQPLYSPDSTKIAYLQDRNEVRVYNLKTKKSHTVLPKGINYSYADGDQYFIWSPDSRYLLIESQENTMQRSEVVLVNADGTGNRINLTNSGFNDIYPQWGLGGKMMYYLTDIKGMHNLSRGSQMDIYTMFFDKEAWDKFNLSKEDYDLLKEQEKRDSTDTKKSDDKKGKKGKDKKKEETKPLQLDLTNLDYRTKRLTISSGDISDAKLSEDGEKLYFIARYEKEFNLWVTEPRTHKTKVLAQLDSPSPGSMELSKDGKSIFILANGTITKVNTSDGSTKPVQIDGEMELNTAGERAYIYRHVWSQVKDKLYDPKLNGCDWTYYGKEYAKFLPYINNDYDFAILLSELLGELDVSHTGAYGRPKPENADRTAALGMLYDETRGGNGLIVKVIIPGGPVDKASSKVKPGDILEKINGNAITDSVAWAKYLNKDVDKFTQLSFYDPRTGKRWNTTVKPIGYGTEDQLLHERWTHWLSDMTDSLSHGELGYVHVDAMNESSYRHTIDKVLGKDFSKKALIVDTRFNGGGWLHDDLATFLTGKLYMRFAPQGHLLEGGESMSRWNKPSCVIMSQSNYSDAFMFPYVYHQLHIGKLIGMPVPGTGTAVWWETQIDPRIVFGIPMIASIGSEGVPTENMQLYPDIRVNNDYSKVLNGEDQQLERSVQEMLKEVKNEK